MNDNIIRDIFEKYFLASDYEDFLTTEIIEQKRIVEQCLDYMWRVSNNNERYIAEYKKVLIYLKEAGFKALRDSKGKHKIVEI